MSYFGIPRGRRKAFAQVRLMTDNSGNTHLYRDNVLQTSPSDPIAYAPGAWTELVSAAQNTQNANQIEIFDSSGNTGLLGTGAASSEVVLLHVLPGGNGIISVRIDAGTRIAVRPLIAPAINTEFTINFYD